MERILRNQFVYEKKVFEDILLGSALQEITYTETFIKMSSSRTVSRIKKCRNKKSS